MKKLRGKNKLQNKNGEIKKKSNEDLNKKKLVGGEKVKFGLFLFNYFIEMVLKVTPIAKSLKKLN